VHAVVATRVDRQPVRRTACRDDQRLRDMPARRRSDRLRSRVDVDVFDLGQLLDRDIERLHMASDLLHQLHAADALIRREVLDKATRVGDAAAHRLLEHQHVEPRPGGVDCGRHSGDAPAHDDEIALGIAHGTDTVAELTSVKSSEELITPAFRADNTPFLYMRTVGTLVTPACWRRSGLWSASMPATVTCGQRGRHLSIAAINTWQLGHPCRNTSTRQFPASLTKPPNVPAVRSGMFSSTRLSPRRRHSTTPLSDARNSAM